MRRTNIPATPPPVYAGRIDELLEQACKLLIDDEPARHLYLFAMGAQEMRGVDVLRGRRPRAPLAWVERLDQIAEWIGFR